MTKKEQKRQAADRELLPAVCNGIWLVITVLVILACLPFVLPRAAGLKAYTIVSGSMEPKLPTGSLAYVEPVRPEELEAGEIVTFFTGKEGDTVTHRITENRRDKEELATKGDANEAADPKAVPYGQVIGRVKGHVPYLGWLYPFIAGKAGKLRLLALLLAALLFRTAGTKFHQKNTCK